AGGDSVIGLRRRAAAVTSTLPDGQPAVQACDLGVRLGGRTVLHGVSVTVFPGETVALIGPNGAGKSTLLGALSGDRATAAGSVTVAGRPVPDWPAAQLARIRAVLPQSSSVSFAFS